MRGPSQYLFLSIVVAEIGWTGLRIDFLINSEVGHFMACVINVERERWASYMM